METNYSAALREKFNSFPIFDSEVLYHSFGADAEGQCQFLSIYFDLLCKGFAEMQRALTSVEYERVRFHAHKMRGSSMYAGAKRLESIFEHLENLPENMMPETASTLLILAISTYKETLAVISGQNKDLSKNNLGIWSPPNGCLRPI